MCVFKTHAKNFFPLVGFANVSMDDKSMMCTKENGQDDNDAKDDIKQNSLKLTVAAMMNDHTHKTIIHTICTCSSH